MNKLGLVFAILVMVTWGTTVFFDKLATNRLGANAAWLSLLGTIPGVFILFIFALLSQKYGFDQRGMWWLWISVALNSVGVVLYYLVFTRAQLSVGVAITALYPVWAVMLGLVVLHERLSLQQMLGVGLSLAAIYLLSK